MAQPARSAKRLPEMRRNMFFMKNSLVIGKGDVTNVGEQSISQRTDKAKGKRGENISKCALCRRRERSA
jgi:hypothetical protein